MILSVTLNPSVDHTLFVDGLAVHDTNRVRRTETDAGGKGVNLSRVAHELGVPTLATGFLGGGPGAFVRHVLDQAGVPHAFVPVDGTTRTNISVEAGDGPPTTLNEAGPTISGIEWEALVARVAENAPRSSWVALGGSLPPGAPVDAFRTLGAMARDAGVKWAVDADGEAMRLALAAGPDFVKPNVREAERLLGHPLPDADALARGAQELAQRMADGGSASPIAVVSRGAEGAVLATLDTVFMGDAILVQTKSTIGSGDSMIAGILGSLSLGRSLADALAWGLASGAATAMTDGTEIGRRAQIEALVPQAVVR